MIILMELMFLKELMLIKQAIQKSAMFVTIGNQMSAIDAMIY